MQSLMTLGQGSNWGCVWDTRDGYCSFCTSCFWESSFSMFMLCCMDRKRRVKFVYTGTSIKEEFHLDFLQSCCLLMINCKCNVIYFLPFDFYTTLSFKLVPYVHCYHIWLLHLLIVSIFFIQKHISSTLDELIEQKKISEYLKQLHELFTKWVCSIINI